MSQARPLTKAELAYWYWRIQKIMRERECARYNIVLLPEPQKMRRAVV